MAVANVHIRDNGTAVVTPDEGIVGIAPFESHAPIGLALAYAVKQVVPTFAKMAGWTPNGPGGYLVSYSEKDPAAQAHAFTRNLEQEG